MDLAINNVTNLCNSVGKIVCVCMCISLLSTFITLSTFKIHLTNILHILIKMVDFKNLAWATSFVAQASRKFIHSVTGQVKKKVIVIPCHDTVKNYLE